MKLYKDGHEVYAEKDQVELLIEDGWSKTKSSNESKKSVEVETESEEILDDADEILDDEVLDDSETKPAPKKIGKKAIKK